MKEVSPFLKSQFQSNEEVNFVANISSKPMIIYSVLSILFLFFLGSISGAMKILYIWLIPWIAYFVFYILYFFSAEFIITNERVLGKSGLISRRTVEVPLSQGEGLVVNQSIIGRVFNYGRISNSGTGTTKVSMFFLDDPFLIRKKILESKSQYENNQN